MSGAVFASVLLGVAAASWLWYSQQLKPVNQNNQVGIQVVIEQGMGPSAIGARLEELGVIRSSTAFWVYTKTQGVQQQLQAGRYLLSPSLSTDAVVRALVRGDVTSESITFYPGATLIDNKTTDMAKRQDITASLLRAGFSEMQIAQGLAADYSSYDSTLFQGRPADAGLEGYIYGDTYSLPSGATVEATIRLALDELWQVVEDEGLVAKYDAQGLTLFEGITLASIVQKESIGGDEAGIAQVFLTRLSLGMPLGSDVTYQYIADRDGLVRDPTLQSPYNTRVVAGLPPGPISTPGIAALRAIAAPSDTDYLYFLSGDDDVTYFARTLQEHEVNRSAHCQVKCQIL